MQARAKVWFVSVALVTLGGCAGEEVDDAKKPTTRTSGSAGSGGYPPIGYGGFGSLGKSGASSSLPGSGGNTAGVGGVSGMGGGWASNAGASGTGTARGGSGGASLLATGGANSAANCSSLTVARLSDGTCVPRVTEFDVARKPTSIVTDSDGHVWVDDDEGNQLIQLDKDGRISRRIDCNSGSSPRTLVAGRDDALIWYTEAGGKNLIKVTRDSDRASVTFLGFVASAIALGKKDELFLAEEGKAIYRAVPEQTPPTRWQASPTDVIVMSPDNNVWTSQGPMLARLTPSVGVKNFELSEPSYASGLCVGPDMALWISDGFAHQLLRVGLDGRLSSPINLPTNTQPGQIITGPDNALWFAEGGMVKIGRFNPKTGDLDHFPIPSNSAPNSLTVGADGNIWFSEWERKVGRLIPDAVVP